MRYIKYLIIFTICFLITNSTTISFAYFNDTEVNQVIELQSFSDTTAANKTLEFLYSLLPTKYSQLPLVYEYNDYNQFFKTLSTPEIILYESILDLYLLSQSKSYQTQKFELSITSYQTQILSNNYNYFKDYLEHTNTNKPLVTPPSISIFNLNNTTATASPKQIIQTFYSVLPQPYQQGSNSIALQVESIIHYILEMESIKNFQQNAQEKNINWAPVAANSFEKINITESTLASYKMNLKPSSKIWRDHLILFIRPPAPSNPLEIQQNQQSYISFKNYLNLKEEGVGNTWDQAYSYIYNNGLTMTSDDIKVGLALIDGDHAAEYSLLEKMQSLSDSNLPEDDKFILQQVLFNSTNPTLALRGMRYVFKNDNGQNYDFISSNITSFNTLKENDNLQPDLKLYINGFGYFLLGQQINQDNILETWIQFEAEGFSSLLNNSPRLKQYWEQNALSNIDVGPIGTSLFNEQNGTELGAKIWLSDFFLLLQDIQEDETTPFQE